MKDLPTGTVTFLFSDIEGSTRLWEGQPEAMREALNRHDMLLRSAVEQSGGLVFKTVGDAFHTVFQGASEAIQAADSIQRQIAAESWPTTPPLLVRLAIHTGEAHDFRNGDYFGPAVNRVARILAACHGGQTLLSETTALVAHDHLPPGASMRSLGYHRLKDLDRQELFQLCPQGLAYDLPPPRSPDKYAHTIPVQLASFVGRVVELEQVRTLCRTHRLVTLTGEGGCGKTRLAFQVATELADEMKDGCIVAQLSGVAEPSFIEGSIASTLGLREEPDRTALDAVTAELADRTLLLVLDNCEHLVARCAVVADHLLRHCPFLTILATSREALRISGELVFGVPPLSLPSTSASIGAGDVLGSDAASLFVDRARLNRSDFAITDANAAVIARICRRLDGIPLAIELAAARAKMLTLEQIESRLGDRFRLLRSGMRNTDPRHQTMLTACDWSYDLLTDMERAFFRQLSVFAGGITVEAAHAVASTHLDTDMEELDTLDMLAGLVNKSWIKAEHVQDGRYQLGETLRQYALMKLHEAGEYETARDRHLAWYLHYAETADDHLSGPDAELWFDRLEMEQDNMRAALEWAERVDPDRFARLAVELYWFWLVRCHFAEGRRWLGAALDRLPLGSRPLRALVLNADATLAHALGDYDAAASAYAECLEAVRQAGDQRQVAAALSNLGMVAGAQGNHHSAATFYTEALDLNRRIGDDKDVGVCLVNLSAACMILGDYVRARDYLTESMPLLEAAGDPYCRAAAYFNLAELARHENDFKACAVRLRQARTLYRSEGDLRGISLTCLSSGLVSFASQDDVRAVSLFAAAERIRQNTEFAYPDYLQREMTEASATLRQRMNAKDYETAWASGREHTCAEDPEEDDASADGPDA